MHRATSGNLVGSRQPARAPTPAGAARALAVLAVLAAAIALNPDNACAQSVDIGLGLGLPLQSFVEDEVGREFRVVPQAGYYPTLRERESALGSFHLHLALVLGGYDLMGFIDDIEIRFDFGSFGWSTATITHTTCTPVESTTGAFDPATARFITVDQARNTTDRNGQRCLPQDYEATTDISELELPALQIFNLGVGGRSHLLDASGWTLWLSGAVGLVVATFADPGAEFFLGGSIAAGAGISYAVSDIVSIKLLEARATFAITEAPDSIQNRLNHDTSSPRWIGSQLMETFAWVDFQLGLSFAF